jgi:hypothetical protein
MRELNLAEIETVSGGDMRGGTGPFGLPLLDGTDEKRVLESVTVTPEGWLVSQLGIEVGEKAGSADVSAPDFPFPDPYGFWTEIGIMLDNPFTMIGFINDYLGYLMAHAADGMPLHPDDPNNGFNFDGCNYQCPW